MTNERRHETSTTKRFILDSGEFMDILGFIPARGGSKGIPRKNIYPMAGKPLIAYSIEQALQSKISRTIVSTDSPEIAEIAQEWGADVPFLRPKSLAMDDSNIEDALQYTLQLLKEKENYEPDIIVLLHPTTPLRTSKHIDESIQLLLEKRADSVVSVSVPMEHPAEMVYWDDAGRMQFLMEAYIMPGRTQRQQYPKCYFLNGVIYTFTGRSFKKMKSRFGERSIPYVIRQIDSIDIDSMDDMRIAEAILNQKK
jgi:CMP-N-acetylneuraminic acid synthetase